MHRITALFFITLLCLLAAAPQLSAQRWGKGTKGSRNVISQERNLSGFDAVEVSGGLEVILIQQSGFSLTVEADDNILDQIITEVRGKRLFLRTEGSIINAKQMRITVGMPTLTALSASGGTLVKTQGRWETDEFQVATSGGSNVTMSTIKAGTVRMATSGGSLIKISGETDEFVLAGSGGSRIDADQLRAQNVEASSSGASSISVYAARSITANASGASSLSYDGRPEQVRVKAGMASSVNSRN